MSLVTVFWDDKHQYLQSERDRVQTFIKENAWVNTTDHMITSTISNRGLELRIYKWDKLIDVHNLKGRPSET